MTTETAATEVFVLTATLSNARRMPAIRGEYLSGLVQGDRLERFHDGQLIHTNYIVREIEPNVFLTKSNSVYRVASWQAEPAQAA